MKPVRVLIADNNPTIRDGLVAIIETQPDLLPVGEAGDGDEAVAMARQLRPDVVLMDVDLPFQNGLEATRRIKEDCPDTRVIVLSVYRNYLPESFAAGASRFLLKDSPPSDLMQAIRTRGIR